MIRRQVVVPAPPDAVWEFLTAADDAGPWLGGRMTWQAEEGGELTFAGEDGSVRRGVVEAVRPARYLRFRWWPEDSLDGPATVVAYLLESDEGRTRLTVQESVADRPAGPAPVESDPAGSDLRPSSERGGGRPDGSAPRAGSTFGGLDCSGPIRDLPHTPLGASASLSSVLTWNGADDRGFRTWALDQHLCDLSAIG